MSARRATAHCLLLACLATTGACGAASHGTTSSHAAAPTASPRDAAFWQAQVDAVADIVSTVEQSRPSLPGTFGAPGGLRSVAVDEGRVTAALFAAHVAVRSDDTWQTLALPENFDASAMHRLGRGLVIVGYRSVGEILARGEGEPNDASQLDVRLAWLTVDGTRLGALRQGPSLVRARVSLENVSDEPLAKALHASAVAASGDAVLVLDDRGQLYELRANEARPAPFATLPSTWNVWAMAMLVRDTETLWLSDGKHVFAWTGEGVRQIDETTPDARTGTTDTEERAMRPWVLGDGFVRDPDGFRFDGRRWVDPAQGAQIPREDEDSRVACAQPSECGADALPASLGEVTELAEALDDRNQNRWKNRRIALDPSHVLVGIQRLTETPAPIEFFVVDSRERVLGRARVAAPAPN